MKSSRYAVTGVAMALTLVVGLAISQEPAKRPAQDPAAPVVPQPGQPQALQPLQPGGLPGLVQPGFPGGGDLVNPAGLEKLALSKEQKADYDKLNEEFQKKQKELQSKLNDTFKNPDTTKPIDPNSIKDAFEAMQKLRPEYLTKLESKLTDEQKKTFEEVRRQQPFGPGGFGPGGFGPGGFPQPFPFGGQRPGQFLPPDVQKKLNLTPEQKKKIDELQQELESKVTGLLTDEQKKTLDELKKNRGPGGFGPPNIEFPKIDFPKIVIPGGGGNPELEDQLKKLIREVEELRKEIKELKKSSK